MHSLFISLRKKLGTLKRKMISKGDLDLYDKYDYMTAYRKHTDMRVEKDYQQAIGGRWEEIGTLQFEFLKTQGLQPEHTLLDIGCGTLRGGRYFIKYLNSGNYTGTDISEKAIEYAHKLLVQEQLEGKRANLLVTNNLHFSEFEAKKFDYILAQSVFTHLLQDEIESCFSHIGKIMHDNSKFYFTFFESPEFIKETVKNFRYPFLYFETLAEKYDFTVKNVSKTYTHPRNQSMALLTKKQSS